MVKLIFGWSVPIGTNDIEVAQSLRDLLLDATRKTTSSIPRVRGQEMPDVRPEVCESRAVFRGRPGAVRASVQPL